MKRSFKVSALCLFATLLTSCLPQEKLTGRVIDTAGPVAGAAVLAMVWVEDADKALPAPDIRNLAQMDLDIILEKDMKARGLPAAYARAFTDENGMFDLDTLHFSAETKKAVKVMAQPKISRITLNAFQRGYLKHAATVFPKDISKELSPAVVRLSKPESWKQLALDNPFRTLRRDEYDQGYSKEFGATKVEKKWFLDYISSNLNEAYQASNIKGDKQWEEDCGRDFSDIVISSSGMQRNPNHEKCNELLREMGVLRDWEKLWVDHSYAPDARQTPAINAIKEAVNALEPEFAEIKQYEAQIIAGAEEAAKEYTAQAQKNLRDGLSEASPLPPEAQNLYRNGDKAGAYKALGHALYSDLPVELKQGIVTAMLPTVTLPRIKETTVGFYLLQNRPLTAQLPGGDGGNHKDEPKVELDMSTEIAKSEWRFQLVKKYGSEQESKADRYIGRSWIDKTDNGFVVYDGTGKVKKEIKKKFSPFENPTDEQISEKRYKRTHAEILGGNQGLLMQEREYKKEGDRGGRMLSSTWTIYDSAGGERGRFFDSNYYVAAPAGKYFVGTYGYEGQLEGVLRFRDEIGKVIREQKPFEWEGMTDRIVFSDDGSYGIYLCAGPDKGGVAVFNSTGGVVSKYIEDNWDPVGPFESGPDNVLRPLSRVLPRTGKILVVDSNMRLTCFDLKGNKLWTKDYSSLTSSENYGNICLAAHPGKKNISLVFNIKRIGSYLEIVDATNGDDIGHVKLPIFNAPAAPNTISQDYPEKPWDNVITYIVDDFVVLAYANARAKDKKIVSGAMLFNFDGEQLDAIELENPEKFWVDQEGRFYAKEAVGTKQWKIEKIR